MDQEAWNKWSWKRMSASGVVFEGPGWIKLLVVTPNTTKRSLATFYDGVTIGGANMLDVQTPTGATKQIHCIVPIRINTGFYVAMDGDARSVSVQYTEDPRT